MEEKIYLFRMTHIDNMPHILQYGITHHASPNANPNFRSIGDSSLIHTRQAKILTNGKVLGDYIPFYFGCRMPMLYVIHRGYNQVVSIQQEDIIYCVCSIQSIMTASLPFVFTDGHAVNALSSYYYDISLVQEIRTLLDFDAINAKYWADDEDLDLKRRKEAEFLIATDVPLTTILGYVVMTDNAKQRLVNTGIDAAKIVTRPNFYF